MSTVPFIFNSSHGQLPFSSASASSVRHQDYINDDGDVERPFCHEGLVTKKHGKDLCFPRLYKSPRIPQVACISQFEAMKIRSKVYRMVLEFAFWKSPYPSRANKLVLAKAQNMTYKQINIWNRRDRHKGCSDFNIDHTTTLEQLEKYIQYFLDHRQSRESGIQGSSLEVTYPEEKRITNSAFHHELPTSRMSMNDPQSFDPQEGNSNQAVTSNVFSFPKPNWLRKPSQRPAVPEKKSPVTVDGLVSRFDSCRVEGYSKTIPVQEPPPSQVAEEQMKSSNPFAGRILKNLPRRRLPKHAPVSQDKCEPSRKIRPLPRRASPFTDSSVSEPSDEESFTSLLSSNMSSSNESLQDATSRALTTTHSPIEKVLSWRKKNSASIFNL